INAKAMGAMTLNWQETRQQNDRFTGRHHRAKRYPGAVIFLTHSLTYKLILIFRNNLNGYH
ncbi:hypothetical protein O5286_28925, partial [Escherichia coli]|nr:hypothetical protein [Escherichia coli]